MPVRRRSKRSVTSVAVKATETLGKGLNMIGTGCRIVGGVANAINRPFAGRLANGVAADLVSAAEALGAAAGLISGRVVEAEFVEAPDITATEVPSGRKPRKQ